ncbi:GNAT family N-acetyltransferase [Kibdelosporangium persicum]|uniref:N-acetyltransferase domain-containing protein n=1 Tax=Kibdelosporangium persicum TaxID=2698649 RepID=A0ABX2FEC6_9PSEU|nr:GNAT family protein [Kibdelosporangium persicum]NRN69637.1 hypothetical protein [Kibdelosporangium persicum]
MTASRLPVRARVLAVDLSRFPKVWPAYRRGLHEVYAEIGAGDLAIGPELPVGVTKVVVAFPPNPPSLPDTLSPLGNTRTPENTSRRQIPSLGEPLFSSEAQGSDSFGDVVGGVLLRDRTEIGRYTGLTQVADAIAERAPQGVNEIGGCWIHPAWRGARLGTTLVREAVRASAGDVRWTVALANQFSVGISAYAGFVPDPRFRDLPFPDNRFRSTLCWFDHRGAAS